MDFLSGKSFQVTIGSELSSKHVVENGTPQGSVVSPILFSAMINDIFRNKPMDMGRSLSVDALRKRGRDGERMLRKYKMG